MIAIVICRVAAMSPFQIIIQQDGNAQHRSFYSNAEANRSPPTANIA